MDTLRNKLIKLAYEQPRFRDTLLAVLRTAEEEGTEEKAETPKKRKGPPPKWDEFLKAKYDGGKKKVSNPNSKTREQFPTVSASTAMKDKTFFKRVMGEYKKWMESSKKTESKPSPKAPESAAPPKEKSQEKPPEAKKKGGFNLPPDRFNGKKVEFSKQDGFFVPEGDMTKKIDVGLASKLFTAGDIMDVVGATSTKQFTDIIVKVDTKSHSIHVESYSHSNSDGEYNLLRYIEYDGDGKFHIHNDTLYLSPTAPKGLGTRLFANQVAKAREMGNITYINCLAYRDDPGWVGYKVWPKMGYDGEVPAHVWGVLDKENTQEDRDIVKRLKAAGAWSKKLKVSDLYKVEGGEKWWEEHGDSFDATFDLTPGSQSLMIHDAYIAKKAKEAGQTLEEFMSKIAAKSNDPKKSEKPEKKPKGKGDNVTLEDSDHKILDEIWKSMRKKSA